VAYDAGDRVEQAHRPAAERHRCRDRHLVVRAEPAAPVLERGDAHQAAAAAQLHRMEIGVRQELRHPLRRGREHSVHRGRVLVEDGDLHRQSSEGHLLLRDGFEEGLHGHLLHHAAPLESRRGRAPMGCPERRQRRHWRCGRRCVPPSSIRRRGRGAPGARGRSRMGSELQDGRRPRIEVQLEPPMRPPRQIGAMRLETREDLSPLESFGRRLSGRTSCR
jgi:hypothetical protein